MAEFPILCPNCGENQIVAENGLYRCNVCGTLFTQSQSEEINSALKKAEREKKETDLGGFRHRLSQALSQEYWDKPQIISLCDKILDIFPDDFQACFFKAYVYKEKNPKAYERLLNHTDKLTNYEKKVIFPYLIGGCTYAELSIVTKLLCRLGEYDHQKEALNRSIAQRYKENELFANVPRDVFICHASQDLEKILPIIKIIEENGYRCWYSERNEPKDEENYLENIQKAIGNCRVFLAFSSMASQLSKAVQWEIDYAEQVIPIGQRIEYRIEKCENTVKFANFFNGLEWIDGYDPNQLNLNLLLQRIEAKTKNHFEKPAGPNQPKKEEPLREMRKNDAEAETATQVDVVAISQNQSKKEKNRKFYDSPTRKDEKKAAAPLKLMQTVVVAELKKNKRARRVIAIVVGFVLLYVISVIIEAIKPRLTVTFQDQNGTTLYTEKIKAGKTPSYQGDAIPMVTYVDEKHFLFSTWDKPLEAIYSDTTYTVVQTKNVFGIYKVSSSEKELIPWDVLDWQDNTFTLISRYVLDQYRWNYSVSLTAAGNNNVTYVKSSVRTWLVKTFLNDIFSTDEQAYLLASTVDNSLTTTEDSSNPSLSPSTLDKIWLPSYQEMTLDSYGFSTDASRMCFGGYETDSFGSTCSYLLRTRSGTDGKIKAVGAKGEITTVAGNSNCGIRPMIRLSVK